MIENSIHVVGSVRLNTEQHLKFPNMYSLQVIIHLFPERNLVALVKWFKTEFDDEWIASMQAMSGENWLISTLIF